ncbi:MAG: UbiA family prenyltransferase [Verrucomicrobiota bacterium]
MRSPALAIRTWLVLGRVSNLPTVWSNCLAAWLLNGGSSSAGFGLLCLAATLLYLGGMLLNDAFDTAFDREFRKDRPIPSGQITARTVWLTGSGLLACGWLGMLRLGVPAALSGLGLAGAILLYDAVHKRTAFAPLLMALCRLLLYTTAGLATHRNLNPTVIWHGLGLAAYVTGLSCFARNESGPQALQRWPVWLLIAPLATNAFVNPERNSASWIGSALLLSWIIWCLRGWFSGNKPDVGRVVAGLLAGIVLIDASAILNMSGKLAVIFAAFFALALLLQKKIPAT